jgi:hypothetical protein
MFARSWGGYLTVVLIIGLVGGVAMASVAAGRRTQSSYPVFLASTNPSDLTMAVYVNGAGGGLAPDLVDKIVRLADVKSVATLDSPALVPLKTGGAPRLGTLSTILMVGSRDGMLSTQDRLSAVRGRLANPDRPDEITLTSTAARIYHTGVGRVLELGLYGPAQESESGFGTAKVPPLYKVRARVVGIVDMNTQVVQDGIDQSYGFAFVTRALLRRLHRLQPDQVTPVLYGLQLRHGDRGVAAVERQLVNLVPRGYTYEFHLTSRIESEVELALKPESVALGAFGAIAALVCLVLASQAISRVLRRDSEDRRIMRALGAGPRDTFADGLVGVVGAVVVGSLLAVLVAVGLSPLSPLGPIRTVYPKGGMAFDGLVFGLGVAILLLGLCASAALTAYRGAPQRSGRGDQRSRGGSSIARLCESAGLPLTAVVGVHFALEPGEGRTAVPVRSALAGTVLAVATVVATLTFASGLSTLVSHPALYGWNWTYALSPTNDVPPAALRLLRSDADVAAWTGYNYTVAEIDGVTFPILLTSLHPKVSPPILTGHGLNADDDIVLGASTMAALHKHVGDTVEVSYGSPKSAPVYVPPTKLTIVGTATFPAIGYFSFVAEHTSMGNGAMVPESIQPPAFVRASTSPDPNLNGPELVFVRLRAGVSPARGRAGLEHVAAAANRIFARDPHGTGNGVDVLGVQRPAQIENYRTMGTTPAVLAGGLALGAIVALGLTLATSVRRRRRDLALLKTLGFTQRQLTATIVWQATVDALVGVVIGLPLGVVIGRELWLLFARGINAVPDATVPVLSIVLVGIGTVVFSTAAAVLPGRSAARASTALVLRAE